MSPINALAFFDSPEQLLVIFLILLLIFGSSKLPQLGSAMGKTIKNFKQEMRDAASDEPAGAIQPQSRSAQTAKSCQACGNQAANVNDAFCAKCGKPI